MNWKLIEALRLGYIGGELPLATCDVMLREGICVPEGLVDCLFHFWVKMKDEVNEKGKLRVIHSK